MGSRPGRMPPARNGADTGYAELKHWGPVLAGAAPHGRPARQRAALILGGGGLVTMADFLGLGLGDGREWPRDGFRT